MTGTALQVVDNILLNYNVGDVLLLAGVLLGIGGLAVQGSRKLFGLHLATFGLLFAVLPGGMLEPQSMSAFNDPAIYRFVGLALLVVAPIILAVSRR